MTFDDLSVYPTVPLVYVATVTPSNIDKKSVAGETPVQLCNYTDIYYNDRITGHLEFMEATATATEIERFELHEGDLLITKDSETADDIGIPALVTCDLPGVLLGYHTSLIRPDRHRLDPEFLFWVFKARTSTAFLETKARGVTRVGLRSDDVEHLPVPLPEVTTQRQIAAHLNLEAERLAMLAGDVPSTGWKGRRSSIRDFVSLLHEHQEALVTAAVTGQITV